MLSIAQSLALTCKTPTCSEDARFSYMLAKNQISKGVAQALNGGLVFDYIQRLELTAWTLHRRIGQIALGMVLVHIVGPWIRRINTAALNTCMKSVSLSHGENGDNAIRETG